MRRPTNQSAAETTGLKCAPETGPNTRIRTASPKTVAVLFSSSCSPTLPAESRSAAIPDPTTTVTSSPVPTVSASSRRHGASRETEEGGGLTSSDMAQAYLRQSELSSSGEVTGCRTVDRRAAIHAALGEPLRLAIVDHLLLGDASPSELAADPRAVEQPAGLPPRRPRQCRRRAAGQVRGRRPPPVRPAPTRRPDCRRAHPAGADRGPDRIARPGRGPDPAARLRLHRELRQIPARRRSLATRQPDPCHLRRHPPRGPRASRGCVDRVPTRARPHGGDDRPRSPMSRSCPTARSWSRSATTPTRN